MEENKQKASLAEEEMAKIRAKNALNDLEMGLDQKKLLDRLTNYRYSFLDTLSEFIIKSNTEKSKSKEAYIAFLTTAESLYSESASYHFRYTDSDITKEHEKIVEFCAKQLKLI